MNAMNLAQLTTNVLAAGGDGRWMGYDYVMALLAGTFPAWSLFTLVRGWVCGRAVPVAATPPRAESYAPGMGGGR